MTNIRSKPKLIEIPESQPFAEDALSRKESAEILTDFAATINEPMVLAIDSPFGTGKTTFLQMWIQHLKNEGFPCLYFNSWENDFSESALVSLIGEMGAGIEALKLGDKQGERVHKIFEQTKRAGAALVKAALPTALKIATSGLLDIDKGIEADLGKFAEDMAKKQIEKYQADKKAITTFRNRLTELAKELAERKGNRSPRPVVFIIDELDRCRPLYAVELLEKVKHLFSVDGLVFVLGIDRQQLAESIKTLYGSGMDANGYLKRFIDLEYQLPAPNTTSFVESQFARFGMNERIEQLTEGDSTMLKPYLVSLFELFRFPLRTQQQCFTRLSIVLRTTPPKRSIYGPLLVLLICLREAFPALYRKYVDGIAQPSEVLDYLRSIGGDSLVTGQMGITLEAYLIYGMRDAAARDKMIESCVQGSHIEKPSQSRSTKLARQFRFIELPDFEDLTAFVTRRIEMAAKFVRDEGASTTQP